MKKIYLGILSLVIIVIIIFFALTSPMVSTANNFFKAISENNITKAESYLSNDFKKSTTQKQLVAYLNNYKIIGYKDIDFGLNRTIGFSDNIGTVKGEITTKDDETSPIKLTMNKEDGQWKIFYIEKELTKAESEKAAKEKEIKANYIKISRINMHYLAKASDENNMTILYDQISKVWQKETSPKKLAKTYGIFHEKEVKLLSLDKISPVLTTIALDKNNTLTLAGYYTAGKNKVHFIQRYVVEDKIWRLVAFKIEIK